MVNGQWFLKSTTVEFRAIYRAKQPDWMQATVASKAEISLPTKL